MRERNAALMRKDDPEPDFWLEAAVSLNRKRLRGEAEWVGLKMALPALEEALAVV